MEPLGKILMADDEETFLQSTAALLRRRGFECDCVNDAPGALAKLRSQQYDLMIADIKMPGNTDLELIKSLPQVAPGMPVIMVTGYPSLESAAQSIELPVVAYLVKPVDFDQLLEQAKISVEYSRTYRAVAGAPAHVQDWRLELGSVRRIISQTAGETSLPGIDAFMTQTFRMIVHHLADMKHMVETLAVRSLEQDFGHQSSTARYMELVDVIFEAISVLERIKHVLPSEELDVLRLKLKRVVKGQGGHLKEEE